MTRAQELIEAAGDIMSAAKAHDEIWRDQPVAYQRKGWGQNHANLRDGYLEVTALLLREANEHIRREQEGDYPRFSLDQWADIPPVRDPIAPIEPEPMARLSYKEYNR